MDFQNNGHMIIDMETLATLSGNLQVRFLHSGSSLMSFMVYLYKVTLELPVSCDLTMSLLRYCNDNVTQQTGHVLFEYVASFPNKTRSFYELGNWIVLFIMHTLWCTLYHQSLTINTIYIGLAADQHYFHGHFV